MEDRPCEKSFGLLSLADVLMHFDHTLSYSALWLAVASEHPTCTYDLTTAEG